VGINLGEPVVGGGIPVGSVGSSVGVLRLDRPDERPELSVGGAVESHPSLNCPLAKRKLHMTNETFHAENEPRKNGPMDAGITDAGGDATVQDAVRKLGSQTAEIGEQVYRQAVDAGRHAGRRIEEQPWAAVIATGLLGLAIGMLLGRATVPAPRTARDYVDEYLPRKLRQR
jgi:hypothetical protein